MSNSTASKREPGAGNPATVPPAGDPLRVALLDSRQRLRELVALAADFAYETDADGCFTFVTPDPALGWTSDALLGRPATGLLLDAATVGFDPFRPVRPTRGRRAWLRRADGVTACLSFSATPLPNGGARGIGQDVTAQDDWTAAAAAALRRSAVLDHILERMRQEVMAPRMMQATLSALLDAMGAEGICVLDPLGDGETPAVLHEAGLPVPTLLALVPGLLLPDDDAATHTTAPDGRPLLACPSQTRFGEQAVLAAWRAPGGRAWDADDAALASSATALVRVILEHEAIQREMARQARTDPLTGLLNRRAFLDEMARRIDRLDREGVPGTLMFVDLDNFKRLNDTHGHEAGDLALCIVCNLLRDTVRPADLVARLGGDEFALWLDGADELAAAERAEQMCVGGPLALAHLATDGQRVGLSIGIATRWPGRGEDVDALIHRADQIMYEVKRAGRGHWRVSRADSW